MSATVAAAAPERELRDLYGRYKTLALAAAAALMLDAPLEEVAGETVTLLEDCRDASRSATRLAPQLAACVAASEQLRRLLDRALEGRSTDAELEAARAAHVRLRRKVWSVLPCEYVPCCATEHAHHHR